MHVQIESLETNLKKLPLFDDTEMRVKANAPEENPGITCKFSAHFANALGVAYTVHFLKKVRKLKPLPPRYCCFKLVLFLSATSCLNLFHIPMAN